MSVDSYLELFTTLFGWSFYGILWDVLVGTGIVYLPFLGILIDNWREPAQGGEVGHASGLSLRRMEIDLFMALLVVVLAGQPATLAPLNAGTLSYTPPPTLLDAAPATATVADSQSTYGSTGFYGHTRHRQHSGLVVCRHGHEFRVGSCGGGRSADDV